MSALVSEDSLAAEELARAARRSGGAGRSVLVVAGLMVAVAGAGGFVALSSTSQSPTPRRATAAPPPAPKYAESDPAAAGAEPVSAEDAVRINAAIPFSTAPVQAAAPFAIGAGADHDRAAQCLTQAIYYEAGFEPREGQEAVAQVILNRVRHASFPKSVCGVVYEGAGGASGCQFTFACDGSMNRPPAAAAWGRARAVALAALAGHVQSSVGEATHYHANYVAPYWGRTLAKVVQIGAHIFYRWPGAAGAREAFGYRYAGREVLFTPPGAADLAEPVQQAAAPEDPQDRHAPDDVGGRVVLGLGWTPKPPPPTTDALASVLAQQSGAPSNSASPAKIAAGPSNAASTSQ